ncbi:sialate O-acetylesterase [bacterium]|nr:sialate O-acetylesterase [bacterium]MDB4477095.1 sialate O-acetylesterase [Rhodopirellula sp.]MDB4540046.1 sialate O-acetylesterase [bacterium]
MKRILNFSPVTLAILLVTFTQQPARADVSLPGFFGDHMVMQRDVELRIWGWCEAGEEVSVTLAGKAVNTKGNPDGTWNITLPAMKASSTPLKLRIKGKNTIEISDILVGEVWLCSGQSNMEWTVAASTNRDAEIAAADLPMIRHLKIAHRPSTVPLDDVSASWTVCSPAVAGTYTAAGYFMAKQLHQELGVPVGLINSSWGGTRVEPWTPPVGFEEVPALSEIYQSVLGRTPGTEQYNKTLESFVETNEAWNQEAKLALNTIQPLPPSPTYPEQLRPFQSHQDPTMLYNGMIHAMVGYPIRGAIWYQGESNHAEGMLYFEKKKALINGWRKLWNQGDFPFYYVQIAPFQYGNEDSAILAKFWEAQAAVQQLPNTGMVVINDIATLNDIHPPNKQDVGKRLALLALKNDYGMDNIVANSPEVESVQPTGKQLKVTFKNAGGGLSTRDGKSPTHFEIIGPGTRTFVPATASIDGATVTLSSDAVTVPVAFRFAWDKLAQPNLTGGTGLPVGACRGGEEPDFLSLLAIDEDYELVYELDLHKLQNKIEYRIDRSSEVTDFDRVGYLIELESDVTGPQKLFVSMNAFTNDASKIAVPQFSADAFFQQTVKGMESYSTVSSLNCEGIQGNIEFWSGNYTTQNTANVPGASGTIYDFGDSMGDPLNGYGSMQVHDISGKQTLFAINHWGAGEAADIGIGNSSGPHRDWTFTSNASSYTSKSLKIYVRPTGTTKIK